MAKKSFPKTIRVTVWWAVGIGAIVALVSGQEYLWRVWILTLVGALALSIASWEHGWIHLSKKPRSALVLLFIWGGMAGLGWLGITREKDSTAQQSFPPPASPGTAVLVQPGGKWNSNCDTVYAPNGTGVEDRGEITSQGMGVNTPSSCSKQEVLSLVIDSLLEQSKNKNFNEARWTQFVSGILKEKLSPKAASDFASQPSLEKKREFLGKLKTSSKP